MSNMGPVRGRSVMVGGRMRSPWDLSSPTCLGTKPLWKAGRSLTFLRHCLKTGGNKVREATRLLPQLGETLPWTRRVGCTQSFPSCLLHTCLSYPWVKFRLQDQRDGTMVRPGRIDPENPLKNLALTLTCPSSGFPGPALVSLIHSFHSSKRKELKGSEQQPQA